MVADIGSQAPWTLSILVLLKSRMWEIHKSGSVRDIEVFSYG